MGAKPEEWKGCLDQRALSGNHPPGLSAALPSRAPFPMAFFPVMVGTSYQCRDVSGDSFPTAIFQQICFHGPTFEETGTPSPCPAGRQLPANSRGKPPSIRADSRRFAPLLPLSRDTGEGSQRIINALTPTLAR